MTKLVIRHGLSQANNRENYGTPAFGNPNAGLMDQGIVQAQTLGKILERNYLVHPSDHTVAVSKMRRTWETANFAGFHTLRPYESLNELSASLTLEELKEIKRTLVLPAIALRAAEDVLNLPPEENIWFTHGLLIVSMCKVLDMDIEPRLDKNGKPTIIPDFCEIRELPL